MNEVLFFVTIFLCFSITLYFYKFLGKTGLLIYISLATIISNIETIKLVNLFGIESTLGTVLYGSTFLATDILNEKYGKQYAIKALLVGFVAMITMVVITSLMLLYEPSPSDFANESLEVIFDLNIRITIASILGFITSQLIDTCLYDWLKKQKKQLWIRNNISTIVSQFIDTIIFVVIVYVGKVSFNTLVSIIVSMYIFKFVIAIFDTPFMYLSKKIKKVSEV